MFCVLLIGVKIVILLKESGVYVHHGWLEFIRVFFFSQAEDGIRDSSVTGVQTCALPISMKLERTPAIRAQAPEAGVRSNFIVGFPGETTADFEELETFLTEARLDAIGVFGY